MPALKSTGLDSGSLGASWPSVDPGDLKHRITITQNVLDAFGKIVSTNAVLRTWANIATIRLTETTKTLVSEVTHTVTMRFPRKAGVGPGMFVTYRSHVYRIQALNNIDERDIILQLRCLALNDAANPDLIASPIDP